MINVSNVISDRNSAVFVAAVFSVIFVCSVNVSLYLHRAD